MDERLTGLFRSVTAAAIIALVVASIAALVAGALMLAMTVAFYFNPG